jgi:hypothetical protein
MIKVLFTSDHEIHGNGEGSPKELMIEPTKKMLDLFNQFGAKLTIMADVAEILRFKKHYELTGEDKFFYNQIVEQMRYAVSTGHDVQLHIHSSYYKAVYENGKWMNYWAEYNLAGLEPERLNNIIAEGKNFLESILKPINKNYSCIVFRAANWSMLPSLNVTNALISSDIKIDTSVFKYGSRSGMVNFDYTSAFNETLPYPYNPHDVRKRDLSGRVFEFPIYCENRGLTAFISLNRLYRVLQSRIHNFKDSIPHLNYSESDKQDIKKPNGKNSFLSGILKQHALKADFNQCTGRQLIRQLKRAENKYAHLKVDVPFVTIGHSKLFNKINEISLKPFLRYVADHPDKYIFATFYDFNLDSYFTLTEEEITAHN